MKKIKFSNKLSIEQRTIALLDENQMAIINGGAKGSKSCPASNSCQCSYTCPKTALPTHTGCTTVSN